MKAFHLILALFLTSTAFAASGTVANRRTQVYAPSEIDRQPKLMVTYKPVYPAELKHDAVAGEVTIECVVDLDGSVRDPVVKISTRKEFELPALQALSKWKYIPGRKDKEKVNVRLLVTVNLEPKK